MRYDIDRVQLPQSVRNIGPDDIEEQVLLPVMVVYQVCCYLDIRPHMGP